MFGKYFQEITNQLEYNPNPWELMLKTILYAIFSVNIGSKNPMKYKTPRLYSSWYGHKLCFCCECNFNLRKMLKLIVKPSLLCHNLWNLWDFKYSCYVTYIVVVHTCIMLIKLSKFMLWELVNPFTSTFWHQWPKKLHVTCDFLTM